MCILLLILFCFVAFSSHAQNLTGNLQLEASKVHATMKDAIFIIRQDYIIRDKKDSVRNALGLNKKPYFGRFYYYALNIRGSLVTSSAVLKPWAHDPNFAMVRDSVRYVPELGQRSYRRLSDTSFQHLSLVVYDSLSTLIDLQDSMVTVIQTSFLQGLSHDTMKTEELSDTTMWYWTLKAKGQSADWPNVFSDSIPSVMYDVQKGKFSPKLDTYVTKNYYASSDAIGGLILSMHPFMGKIEFKVHGIIVRRPKGKFDFKRLKAVLSGSMIKEGTNAPKDPKSVEKVVITPIGSNE